MFTGRLGLFAVASVVLLAFSSDRAKAAEPVEYVRICTTYGQGFFYIPGTDTCMRLGGTTRGEGNVCNTAYGSHFVGQGACPTSRGTAASVRRVSPCLSAGATYYVSGGARCDIPRGGLANTDLGRNWGIDFGVSGGATIFSPNNAFLRGRDTLATVQNDKRELDLGGTSATFGVVVNTWMGVPGFLPLPQGSNFFVQNGIYFPVNSDRSQTVTGVNPGVPNATVTTTVEDKWGWSTYAGFSVPLKSLGLQLGGFDSWRFRIGGGGTWWNRELTVSGTDTGGTFFASKDYTQFEPGLLWGFRGGYSGFIVGLDITHSFPCPELVIAQSVFPSQTYKGSTGSGMNTAVNITISREFFSGGTRIARDFR